MQQRRWEAVDNDAEDEADSEFFEFQGDEEEQSGVQDQNANFNPFDENTFEANIS